MGLRFSRPCCGSREQVIAPAEVECVEKEEKEELAFVDSSKRIVVDVEKKPQEEKDVRSEKQVTFDENKKGRGLKEKRNTQQSGRFGKRPSTAAAAESSSSTTTIGSQPKSMDLFAAPPSEIIENLVKQGRVIPCENHGSACFARYHRHVAGVNMAFYDTEARRDFAESNRRALLSYGSWDRLDISQTNADWAMRYGSQAFEVPFSFRNFKDRLERERASMVAEYAAAVNKARTKEPVAYKALVQNKKYNSFVLLARHNKIPTTKTKSSQNDFVNQTSHHFDDNDSTQNNQSPSRLPNKAVQPTSDLLELYVLSVAALPQLWSIVKRAANTARRKLGRNPDSCLTRYDVKKLMRAQTKLSSDYQGRVELLTDIARASLVCEDIAELRAALDALLDMNTNTCRIVSLKNRWASPVDGYADVLVNVRLLPSNVVCEIQLNTQCIYSLKGDSGHQQYKWLRRLVQPDDIYQGESDAQGRPHGNGRRTFATGDVYEGAYVRGQKHGIGKYQMSDGTYYQGEWFEDKRHGTGFLRFANGNTYDGEFRYGKIEGQGIKRLVNGGSYNGQWRNGKPDGFGEQIFKPNDIYLKYTGSFRQGCKDGRGHLHYTDGSLYEGSFFGDRINGDGKLTQRDGAILVGKFSNGSLVEGEISKPDGSVLQGRFKNGILVQTSAATHRGNSADPKKRKIVKLKAAARVAALTSTANFEFSSSSSLDDSLRPTPKARRKNPASSTGLPASTVRGRAGSTRPTAAGGRTSSSAAAPRRTAATSRQRPETIVSRPYTTAPVISVSS